MKMKDLFKLAIYMFIALTLSLAQFAAGFYSGQKYFLETCECLCRNSND